MGMIPKELTSLHRWVRAVGKRPIRPDGRPASSTDPSTWSSFANVRHGAGDGFGIMLGDGLACWDFDHVTEDVMREKLQGIDDPLFAEVSQSGHGLHVFVRSTASSFRRDGVEFYSHDRFIRMTGRRFV